MSQYTLHGFLRVERVNGGVQITLPAYVTDATLLLSDEQAQRLTGDLVDAIVAGISPEKQEKAP